MARRPVSPVHSQTDMPRFDNRVVIVTGGASGMGAAHVRAFADEGATVVLADIDATMGEQVAAQTRGPVHFANLDVTDESAWHAMVDDVVMRFGRVDVLINNAAILAVGAVEQETPQRFRRVVDVNLTGAFIGMHCVLPLMRKRGSGVVINIGSAAGLSAYPGSAAYVAAKWGLRGLSRSAAMDMAGSGVRVNAVFPGPTKTPMVAGMGGEYSNDLVVGQPIPRWATADEVSRVVVFLASDEASYCTGGEYAVDGGASLVATLAPQMAEEDAGA